MLSPKVIASLLSLLPLATQVQGKFLFTEYFGTLDEFDNKLTRHNVSGLPFVDYPTTAPTSTEQLNHTTTTTNSTNSTNSTGRAHAKKNLKKRWPWQEDYVSSCGPEWIPVMDFIDQNSTQYIGYESAVQGFCAYVSHTNEKGFRRIVPRMTYFSQWLHHGEDGETVGLDQGSDAYRNAKEGALHFEIHNRKRNQGHIPYYKDCYYYLTRMSQPDSECFGNKHQDTKGGTWQVGSHAISYHALAHSVEDMNKDLNKHG